MMKSTTSLSLLSLLLVPSALAEIVIPNPLQDSLAKLDSIRQQSPIMNIPNIIMPPSKDKEGSSSDAVDGLSISDVIGKERVINIFAGFTRDIESISKRLDDNSQNATVLAPLNSALQKLPRKPWEDPEDYNAMGENAYKGASGEDRAHKNLRRFTEAHIIPTSPWKESEKIESMGGGAVWWENKDGKKVVQPGNIEVSNVASRVSNGEVWVLKECLNYA